MRDVIFKKPELSLLTGKGSLFVSVCRKPHQASLCLGVLSHCPGQS